MFTLTTRPDVLRAALLFTKSEAYGSTMRAEYDHVILDRTLIATDGHSMIVINPGEVSIKGDKIRPVLLPRQAIEAAIEGTVTNDPISLMVDPVGGWVMTTTAKTYPLPTGEIINWDRVYPRHTTGGTSNYNLAYLHRAVRANIELGAPNSSVAGEMVVHHNGTSGPAVIVLTDRRAHVIVNYLNVKGGDSDYQPFLL